MWEKLYVSEDLLPPPSGLKARRFHQNASAYLPYNMASQNRGAQYWYPSAWNSNLMYRIMLKKFKDTFSVPCILNSHPTIKKIQQQTKFWGVNRNISFTLRTLQLLFTQNVNTFNFCSVHFCVCRNHDSKIFSSFIWCTGFLDTVLSLNRKKNILKTDLFQSPGKKMGRQLFSWAC